MSRILASSHVSELARNSSTQHLQQVKDALLQARDLHSKEISKNMKFQDIILSENRKLSRQLLQLTQLLYDQKHQATLEQCPGCERNRGQADASVDLQRLSEGLAHRVAELECENARLHEDFLRATAEKDARLKEQHLAQ